MKVIKVQNYKQLSKQAAIFIAAQMIGNPKSVLGFATGGTPEGCYAELAALYKQGVIDFKEVTAFNLDEYYGLTGDHPQSYRHYMQHHLYSHVNVKPENTHVPDGGASDPAAECARYEKRIDAAGGIDLQLLGIGRNGHVGFNEPCDHFSSMTSLVDLTEDTLDANARYFGPGESPPTTALSMGIGSIMRARKILLVANGPGKKDALDRMINHPVTPTLPASILQFHPDVTVLYCD
ncbi:MAG: glucosamine-6-phosphate deaminase [Oscillospiraceae bacterium]|nr:glucosamine-6-phosphate deaminase [Oscillospiraceae bacterium]